MAFYVLRGYKFSDFMALSEVEQIFLYTTMVLEEKRHNEELKAFAQIIAGGRLRL